MTNLRGALPRADPSHWAGPLLGGEERLHLLQEDRPGGLVLQQDVVVPLQGHEAASGIRAASRRPCSKGGRWSSRACSTSVGLARGVPRRVTSMRAITSRRRAAFSGDVERRWSSLKSSQSSLDAVGHELRGEHLPERRVVLAPPEPGELDCSSCSRSVVRAWAAGHPTLGVRAVEDEPADPLAGAARRTRRPPRRPGRRRGGRSARGRARRPRSRGRRPTRSGSTRRRARPSRTARSPARRSGPAGGAPESSRHQCAQTGLSQS